MVKKEGEIVDKVIQNIVDVDLEWSKRVEEAKQKKLDLQTNMNEKKKEIYESFSQEYKVKIETHKKELEEKIQSTKTKNEEEYQASLNQLSSLYEDNKDKWVEAIVNRCKEI